MRLAWMLRHLIRQGRLDLIDAQGVRHIIGSGARPDSTIRLYDKATERQIMFNPRLAFGEAYVDGRLTIEQGDVYDLLRLLMHNVMITPKKGIFSLIFHGADQWLRRLQQFNSLRASQKNVSHHYDLSADLYDLFLDSDRQYSCAYFEHLDFDLETAQAAKKRHLASKLLLKPGQRVLDIGCGWGGLGLYLASETGADVTGLTLSHEQLKIANGRAAVQGIADRTRFILRDYREEQGKFDRIVSVGMFEHVGVGYYQDFFNKIGDLLTDDGIAVVHAIGRSDGPGNTNPWLRKYIFPGGYCPALSEVMPAIEKAGLWTTDIEILRLHYAETLLHWRQRFLAHRDQVRALYDERFCRMWEFYLAACEAGFRVQELMVFQIQLAKNIDAVPITRNYMNEWERQHPLPVAHPPLVAVAE